MAISRRLTSSKPEDAAFMVWGEKKLKKLKETLTGAFSRVFTPNPELVVKVGWDGVANGYVYVQRHGAEYHGFNDQFPLAFTAGGDVRLLPLEGFTTDGSGSRAERRFLDGTSSRGFYKSGPNNTETAAVFLADRKVLKGTATLPQTPAVWDALDVLGGGEGFRVVRRRFSNGQYIYYGLGKLQFSHVLPNTAETIDGYQINPGPATVLFSKTGVCIRREGARPHSDPAEAYAVRTRFFIDMYLVDGRHLAFSLPGLEVVTLASNITVTDPLNYPIHFAMVGDKLYYVRQEGRQVYNGYVVSGQGASSITVKLCTVSPNETGSSVQIAEQTLFTGPESSLVISGAWHDQYGDYPYDYTLHSRWGCVATIDTDGAAHIAVTLTNPVSWTASASSTVQLVTYQYSVWQIASTGASKEVGVSLATIQHNDNAVPLHQAAPMADFVYFDSRPEARIALPYLYSADPNYTYAWKLYVGAPQGSFEIGDIRIAYTLNQHTVYYGREHTVMTFMVSTDSGQAVRILRFSNQGALLDTVQIAASANAPEVVVELYGFATNDIVLVFYDMNNGNAYLYVRGKVYDIHIQPTYYGGFSRRPSPLFGSGTDTLVARYGVTSETIKFARDEETAEITGFEHTTTPVENIVTSHSPTFPSGREHLLAEQYGYNGFNWRYKEWLDTLDVTKASR